jgi:hypothetical protein
MGSCRKSGDGQSSQTDRARRRGMDVVESFLLAVREHLQQRRVEEGLLLVFRQVVGADGRKMNDSLLRRPVLVVAGDQGIGTIGLGGKVDLLLERKGDTVDFIKGVREMGQMNALDGRCGRILFCLTEPTNC